MKTSYSKNRNDKAQYRRRTAINVKLAGVPFQCGEELMEDVSNQATLILIKDLADSANILDFDLSQIDIAHRVSDRRFSPIIIRFKFKRDRKRFFLQRKKLRNIKTDVIDNLYENELKKPTQAPTDGWKRPFIQLQDSLTAYTGELLVEARSRLAVLNYEYPGYIIDGQVKVKKNKKDKATTIRCMRHRQIGSATT